MSEKYCPNCGGTIPLGNSFCQTCGCRVKAVSHPQTDTDHEKTWFLTDFLVSMRNTAIVLFIILAIVFVVLLATNTISFSTMSGGYRRAVDDAIWAHEHFPRWDKLYEAGEYEEMCEIVWSDIQDNNFDGNYSYWKHYDFFNYYNNSYLSALKHLSKFPERFDAGILYDYMRLYSVRYDQLYSLSADELSILNDCSDQIALLMYECYGIPVEDADSIYESLLSNEHISYSACTEYADSYNLLHKSVNE